MANSARPKRAMSTGMDQSELAVLRRLLQSAAELGSATRADLARSTGLARSTVSQYVDQLQQRRLLVEDPGTQPTGGRPAHRLRVNPRAGVILAADLGATTATLAATDLGGQILGEPQTTTHFDIAGGPQRVLEWVDEGFAALLGEANLHPRDVRSVSIGVPGPVAHTTGTVIRPPIMPGWDGYQIPGFFADRYAAPTLVDNDVNLMAVGEYHFRRATGDFLFVKVGTGVGCGIINNGRLHRGAEGAAGDIGHIRVPDANALCRCGNTGCLEAVASGGALARDLAKLGKLVRTSTDVARIAQDGDTEARRAIRAASDHLGEVLATLVSFHNPALIVIGGSLAKLDEALLTGIRSRIYQRALPLATRELRIETSKLGDRAGVTGASSLARDHLLSVGLASLLTSPPPTPRPSTSR
ncbi:MAG TPA: ROK family transcriptional regulator [Mycobacteriales bacterium]|nr:ROK family transcriptional regulator [Mycobacteriales bacterium]